MKTVSLELSKQLKEAGYPQKGCFVWNKPMYQEWELTNNAPKMQEDQFICASPTVDEILDLLPWRIDFGDRLWKFLVISKVEDGYEVGYQNNEKCGYVDGFIYGDNLAYSVAKMWLYLKKKGLI